MNLSSFLIFWTSYEFWENHWHSLQTLINTACLKFGRALLESCFLVEFGVKCSSLSSSLPPVWSRLLFSGIISPRKSKPAARQGFQATFLLTVSSSAGKNNQNGLKQVNWKRIPWTLVTSVGNSEVFISISRSLSLIWQGARDKKVDSVLQKQTASRGNSDKCLVPWPGQLSEWWKQIFCMVGNSSRNKPSCEPLWTLPIWRRGG